jgi:hypothetical protein
MPPLETMYGIQNTISGVQGTISGAKDTVRNLQNGDIPGAIGSGVNTALSAATVGAGLHHIGFA